MASQHQDSYSRWLDRDVKAVERLNRQHALITQTIGYLLHPVVRASLTPSSKIADIGTGTGVVLTELAKSLPATCELDGFDISDAQFPSRNNLPENVQLQVADAKETPSQELHGKYDVVFVRYLNLALSPTDWKVVASNLLLLLKPGGFLQWIESDLLQAARFLRREPEVPVPAYNIYAKRFLPFCGSMEYAARELESILEAQGFRNVLHEYFGTDRVGELTDQWTANTFAACSTAWRKVEAGKGESGYSSEELEKLIAQLYEECKTALYARCDLHVFVGRKA